MAVDRDGSPSFEDVRSMFRPIDVESMAREVDLDRLEPTLDAILAGGVPGRTIVRLAG